jgi:uncharacterized protein DUF6985
MGALGLHPHFEVRPGWILDLELSFADATESGPCCVAKSWIGRWMVDEPEGAIFDDYRDVARLVDGEELPFIARAEDVWRHITLGDSMSFLRRSEDDTVSCSIECNCDWEVEHGLQIVLKNGNEVPKVGPFDGHLSNADAYGDPALEGVVYRRMRR